jgi:hypothetical protein
MQDFRTLKEQRSLNGQQDGPVAFETKFRLQLKPQSGEEIVDFLARVECQRKESRQFLYQVQTVQ